MEDDLRMSKQRAIRRPRSDVIDGLLTAVRSDGVVRLRFNLHIGSFAWFSRHNF